MTPLLAVGPGRAVVGRWVGGRAGVGDWAAAVPMASTGIRQAAVSRTARIVNKRLVPPTARCVANVRHQRMPGANAAHHSDGPLPMLVAAFDREQAGHISYKLMTHKGKNADGRLGFGTGTATRGADGTVLVDPMHHGVFCAHRPGTGLHPT